jgi:hypothetical protein
MIDFSTKKKDTAFFVVLFISHCVSRAAATREFVVPSGPYPIST